VFIKLSFQASDPNHVRHRGAYYDFEHQHRIEILESLGLTMKVMPPGFGPILFREECVFRKEIKLSDKIVMHTKVTKSMKTAQDGLCSSLEITTSIATTTVDAWMDIKLEKISFCLTPELAKSFECFKRIIRSYQTHFFSFG
jgi:acyl-CoA thioester hydrolase